MNARASLLGLALFALAPLPAAGGDRTAGRARADACVQCHGANGISVLPNAPNLAGQPEVYLVEQLRQFRSGRRPSDGAQRPFQPFQYVISATSRRVPGLKSSPMV